MRFHFLPRANGVGSGLGMEHDAGSNAIDFDSAGFDQTLRLGARGRQPGGVSAFAEREDRPASP